MANRRDQIRGRQQVWSGRRHRHRPQTTLKRLLSWKKPTRMDHTRERRFTMTETTAPRVAHQFDDARQQREAITLGMWVFLITEIMMFGALFAGYAVYRHAYPESFASGSRHLNLLLGSINTAVL